MDASNCIQNLHLQQKEQNKSIKTDPTVKSPLILGTHKLRKGKGSLPPQEWIGWYRWVCICTPRHQKVLHKQ